MSSNGVQVIIVGNAEYHFTTAVTVGCLISLKGKIYGLTAAHGLYGDDKHPSLNPEGGYPSSQGFEYEPVGSYGSDDCEPFSNFPLFCFLFFFVLCDLRLELMAICSK